MDPCAAGSFFLVCSPTKRSGDSERNDEKRKYLEDN